MIQYFLAAVIMALCVAAVLWVVVKLATPRRIQRISKPEYSSWNRVERSTDVGFAKPRQRRRRWGR